jgi:hypothetical protein
MWPGGTHVDVLAGGRHGGLVPLEDSQALVPRRVVITFRGRGLDPNFKIFLEVQEGRPTYTGITFTVKPGGRGIRPSDLIMVAEEMTHIARGVFERLGVLPDVPEEARVVSATIEGFVDEAGVVDLLPTTGESGEHRLDARGGPVVARPPNNESQAQAVAQAAREATRPRRGTPSMAELERVAEVYTEHLAGNPVRAVQQVLGYGSLRTASRRITQARKAKILPETTQGKRRA